MLFGEVGPGRYCTFFFSLFSGHPIMESTDAEIKDRDRHHRKLKKESRRFSKSNLPLEVRLCVWYYWPRLYSSFFLIANWLQRFFSLLQKQIFFFFKYIFLLFCPSTYTTSSCFLLSFLGSMWIHKMDRTQSKQVMIWWYMRDRLRIYFGSINESFREQITRFHSIFVLCCAAVIWIFTFGMSYKH